MDVLLRPLATQDMAELIAIGPDREGYLGYGGDPATEPTGGPAWAKAIISRISKAHWGRIIEVDGVFAGEIKLHGPSNADRSARLAIGIFRADLRGRGVGRRAIALALNAAFGPLGLHRVELRVLAKNMQAIRCYEAVGFRHEGRLRQAARIGNTYEDDLIMAILATDDRPALS